MMLHCTAFWDNTLVCSFILALLFITGPFWKPTVSRGSYLTAVLRGCGSFFFFILPSLVRPRENYIVFRECCQAGSMLQLGLVGTIQYPGGEAFQGLFCSHPCLVFIMGPLWEL